MKNILEILCRNFLICSWAWLCSHKQVLMDKIVMTHSPIMGYVPNPTIAKPNQCLTQPPPNPTTAKPNCACCPITRAMNGPGNPGHIDEPHGSPTTIFLHKLGLVEKYTCAKLDLNNLLRGVGVGVGGGLFRNRLYRIEPLLYYRTCLPLMKHEMLPNWILILLCFHPRLTLATFGNGIRTIFKDYSRLPYVFLGLW